MKSAGVDCAVIHPPGSLGDAVNAYAIEAVQHHPDKFCILGNFDLQSPDRENIVAHWRERSPGMLGFRYSFSEPHQKTWLTDGSLDWFWKACEKADLRVGLLVSGPTIPVFGKIAERHPGLKMHIDHIGRGGGRAAVKDDAVYADLPEMLALAKLPNVAVKLSGAPSTSSQPYPYKNIHGYLKQNRRRVRSRPLLLGHRHHPHADLVPAVRDDVHRGDAVAEGPRPRARDGRGHRRLARLEAPGGAKLRPASSTQIGHKGTEDPG